MIEALEATFKANYSPIESSEYLIVSDYNRGNWKKLPNSWAYF